MATELNDTVNILLAFGGSGGKTVAELMRLMANDPAAARIASTRVHIVLCDTDDDDLEKARRRIQEAFSQTGLADPPPIHAFRLADSVDLFQDLVSERMRPMSPEAKSTIRQFWWFEPSRNLQADRPFSASTMPENVNRGAAQCPLVSHFLAWDKLAEFERLLEQISTHSKNVRNLENFSVDLFVVAGLAGGTGRGSWQSMAFKAREFFWQPKNGQRACRPIGFFFDWSCFSDVAEQRPEQRIKLQVNSYTGLSELSMWLRSSLPIDGRIAGGDANIAREVGFMLPSLRAPADRSAAAIDTDRYMPEDDEARLGRTPIHRAYVFTKESRSITLETSEHAYALAAAALYGRLCISATRSADSNEPERACATATSILYVPIAKIRLALMKQANIHRIGQLMHGESNEVVAGTKRPLTREIEGGKDAVEPVDESLVARITAAQAELRKLLDVGSQDQFAAIAGAGQQDSTNAMSLIAFAVSKRGEGAVVSKIENRQSRQVVLGEAQRAISGSTGVVADAVAEAYRLLARDGKATVVVVDKKVADDSVRKALSQKFVTKQILGALKDGVGPARAMAGALRQVADEASKKLNNAAAAGVGAASGAATGPVGFDWAKGYFGMFGLPHTKRDGFRSALRQQICRRAYPGVAREVKVIVDGIIEDIRALEEMLAQAVTVMGRERDRIAADARKYKDECFTALSPSSSGSRLKDQNKMLDNLRNDRATPVSKMIRQLRPIFEQQAFDQIVAQLASDSSAIAYAREELVRFLEDRIASDSRRTSRSAFEFRTSLEERLRAVLERQSVEFRDLKEVFNIESVLDGLMNAWFETYKERKGDASFAGALSTEVEVLTGFDLRGEFAKLEDRKSGTSVTEDDLRPPRSEEVLARAALTLAAGCDPFVQFVGSGDRRDRATVIVPNSPVDGRGRQFKNLIEARSREARNFAHVKAVESPENYFMLVATSDLPKVNFADTGWDGWFSEPSDPVVRKWLEWCESPSGIAPFKTEDGSVGMGYVCPKYVRDEHLSIRRWKPWVKDDRGREQMHRKWVALAYALLGNSPYVREVKADWNDRYSAFVEVFSATFGGVPTNLALRTADVAGEVKPVFPNEEFPDELWTLPLVAEKPSDRRGPSFTRRMWVVGPQGRRRAGSEPKAFEDVTSSMRKFVNWFESEESDKVVGEILAEQAIFANLLAKTKVANDHIHAVTSEKHAESIRKFLREYVSQWRSHIQDSSGLAAEEKERQVQFLDRFLAFFDKGMPDLNLFEPFDGSPS